MIKTLKDILKKKKITYKALAENLDMSEAGIKKMFVAGDLSLSRLIKICDLLGISLNELIEDAQNRPLSHLKLSNEQMLYLSKNPSYFFFFLKLAYERCPIEEIKSEFNLSQKCIWQYLKKLDDLKLISLLPDNKIAFLQTLPLHIETDENFFNEIKEEMAIRLIKKIRITKEINDHLSLTLFKLSAKHITQLKEDVDKLLVSYQRQSEVDKTLLANNEVQNFSLLLAHGGFSFVPPVEELTK